jgi:hypothetical protein
VAEALSMHNLAYRGMFRAGKESLRAHKLAQEALHRAHRDEVVDTVRLVGLEQIAEVNLKRITTWCVASQFDAQVLAEKYAEDKSILKSLESDIARVSLPLPREATIDLRVTDLEVAIQFFSSCL